MITIQLSKDDAEQVARSLRVAANEADATIRKGVFSGYSRAKYEGLAKSADRNRMLANCVEANIREQTR